MSYKQVTGQSKQSYYVKRLLLGGGLTAVGLAVGWSLYTYGQVGLIDPLAERLWRLYLILEMLSQESFWGLLLALAGLNIIFLLLRSGFVLPPPELQMPVVGRVGRWLELLRAAGQPGFFGKQLVGTVRNLLVIDLIIRNGQTEWAVRQQIRAGQLPLSTEARELLGHSQPVSANPALHDHRRRRTTEAIMNEIAAYLEHANEVENES